MGDLGNKDVLSKNLRYLMQRVGKSRNQVCDDLNIKYTTFNDWYNGNKYPRIDKIELLANYFGVLKSDLIEDKTDLPKDAMPVDFSHLKRIPILGQISAGLPLYAEQNIEGYTYTNLNHGGEYFALRVRGDSMNAARIYENDLLIVRKQDTAEDGEIVVAMVGDDEATVKYWHRRGNVVMLEPKSTNPIHQMQIYDLSETKIRIIGKVVQNQISY